MNQIKIIFSPQEVILQLIYMCTEIKQFTLEIW
jgi:hypothetical protein